MELERDQGPKLGMYACDADLFSRVWERVGAEGQTGCPVELVEKTRRERETRTEQEGMPAVQCAPQTGGAPAPETEAALAVRAEPPHGEAAGDDFPVDELPCLGSASVPYSGQLQRYIREELEGWQLYRHLARRINGPNARALTALASEKHRNARRLAAAYFLIAGVRYWPTDRLETPRLPTWLGALRERFSTEQRQEHRYRAAVCDVTDPCLMELFGEMADASAAHAAVVRAVLENAL